MTIIALARRVTLVVTVRTSPIDVSLDLAKMEPSAILLMTTTNAPVQKDSR